MKNKKMFRILLGIQIILPKCTHAVCITLDKSQRAIPDTTAWGTEGYLNAPEKYGYMLPSDPTYGLPKYSYKGGACYPKLFFDGAFFIVDGNKVTVKNMANHMIKNIRFLIQNLKTQKKIQKKIFTGALTDKDIHNNFSDMVLGARDALNAYVVLYLNYFYTTLDNIMSSMKEVLKKCHDFEPKITSEIYQIAKEQVESSKIIPVTWNGDKSNLQDQARRMVIAKHWIAIVDPILQELDELLDTHDLRGTEHSKDYTPPQMDLTRNYWKNPQGQWCSGYGVIFKKREDTNSTQKKYPLLRKEPITDATDYSNAIHHSYENSHHNILPKEWFVPNEGWFMGLSEKNQIKIGESMGKYKKIDDLDREGSKDLLRQLHRMSSRYREVVKFVGEKTENMDFLNPKIQSYRKLLRDHRDQLTLFILQTIGPYYDTVKESLDLAEKTIAELGESIPEKKWKPFVTTLLKKPVNASLLHQNNPAKKLAAAHHIVEKLRPVEMLWDTFLDQYLFLRGSFYLSNPASEGDFGVYWWNNAHGYRCRGFGRLLTPRKAYPPMDQEEYWKYVQQGDALSDGFEAL